MKRIATHFILTIICCSSIYAQKLTLTDLTTLCSKRNWEEVNQILLAKNWTFYESEKGGTSKYNTITWSFNKDYFSDKAQGWFYLYTYEGLPNKILYSVFNKESYLIVENSISSAGFKLLKSEIESNKVISTYENASFTLKITTEKRMSDEYFKIYSNAYSIILVKKAGIYDPDNGKKTEYYYGDVVKTEYILLNGKLNGQVKKFHYNGKLELIGNYKNGEKNGLFKEFDNSGNLEAEYTMSYGELNGVLKAYYTDGKLKKTSTYLKGKEHGVFTEYDKGGNKEVEYTMSNGELNGPLKTYYSNGRLKKSGNYLKGKEHGIFIEFDENGNKEAEYSMVNGLKNGLFKYYVDGKIDVLTTFKDGVKDGQRVEYYYDNDTGKLKLKQVEEYSNDNKSGIWKLLFIDNANKERVLKFENYTNGLRNGQFQDFKGDSLIIGSYKNDELHGEYKVYLDINKKLIGGIINTDTANLTLIKNGWYNEGEKFGYWKIYDITGTLKSEGRFLNGKETGEWRFYYSDIVDENEVNLAYSKQLYLIQNYLNGKLDGKSTRYSYLKEEEYNCSVESENKNPIETCKRTVFQKILETKYYKDGKLNGPFEVRDSLNEIIVKGNFINGFKYGEWLYRLIDYDINDLPYFIFQKGSYTRDLRDGLWIQYDIEGQITESFNYKNGDLHGEYKVWNQFNRPSVKKQFSYGKLTELVTYDNLGLKPNVKFEIYDNNSFIFKCRKTEYFDDGYISQEYLCKSEDELNHNFFELTFLIATTTDHSLGLTAYKDGEYKVFSSSDQPIIIGKYYKEDRVGLWTFYYYEQKVKIESNFTQDKRNDEKYFTLNGDLFSGEFIYNDEENGIKEERKIKDGLRNGKTVYIDIKTKKTIKKESYKNGELK